MNLYLRIFLTLLVGVVAHAIAEQHVRRAESEETEESAATVPEYNAEIRGGTHVETALPWYAVFVDNVLCGGFLVHEDIVVTTANCVSRGNAPTQVRLGSTDRFEGGTVVDVTRFRVHPDWTGDVIAGNDIAVLKLKNTVDNELATMNSVGNIPEMTAKLFVMGFGLINDDVTAEYLQGLFYDFDQLCQNRFDEYNPTAHLCADATPQRGACAGDTGSPAVLSGTKTVVGLASFSDNKCESQTVDVYTRMSSYYAWVNKQICELAANKPSPKCDPATCLFFTWSGIQQVQRFFGF